MNKPFFNSKHIFSKESVHLSCLFACCRSTDYEQFLSTLLQEKATALFVSENPTRAHLGQYLTLLLHGK